ncbi:MAG TPA: hypothetical protein DEA91_28360 [Paenibacillus sp.]|nr:hypothetical protein [Paenibacillus sp.]
MSKEVTVQHELVSSKEIRTSESKFNQGDQPRVDVRTQRAYKVAYIPKCDNAIEVVCNITMRLSAIMPSKLSALIPTKHTLIIFLEDDLFYA